MPNPSAGGASPPTPPARSIRIITAIAGAVLLVVGATGAGAAPFMNQLVDLSSAAVTNVLSGITSLSFNDATVEQESDDESSNQAADAEADADTTVDVSGDLNADNIVAAVQSAVADQSNQGITGGLNAEMNVGLFVDADAIGALAIAQQASGDNAANQEANAAAGAETDVNTDVTSDALNVLDALQESDGDQANQETAANANAENTGVSVVAGTALAAGTTSQQASSGPVNQYVTNIFNAQTFIDTLQNITSMNVLTILQTCNGQCNQVASLVANALANGMQVVLGDATVTSDVSQESTGDGPANQAIDAENASESDVTGAQSIVSINTVDLEQENDGDQGNQQADVEVESVANGTQVLAGVSVIDATASQTADSEDGVNQDIDMDNTGSSAVDGVQSVVSINDAAVAQEIDGDQGNQQADVALESDANGVQIVGSLSAIVAGVSQEANGTNQQADVTNDSSSDVEAAQGIVSANTADVSQAAGADQGTVAQSIDIDADSNASGVQLTDGASVIVTGIDQATDGEGLHNQDASVESESDTVVGALQGVVATNDITAAQEADVSHGAGAQSMIIDPTAVAVAVQDVSGVSGNISGIGQNADGDDANQAADITAGSSTDVDATQTAAAVNVIDASQEQDIDYGAGAQWVMITPVAAVVTVQDVEGASGNVSGIAQDAGDGDQTNQDAAVDAASDTTVDASQNAAAVNDITLQQRATVDHGAVAQAGEVAPVATTVATQDVSGASGNVSVIGQEGGDGDQTNQGATIGADAATQLNAEQNAASMNTLDITQECDISHGACAQYFFIAPTATTVADQNVEGTSGNVSDINQDGNGGEQTNQAAAVDNAAATDIDAEQNAVSANAGTVFQTCTADSSVCAQYTEIGFDASTEAGQDIAADATNETTVEQTGSGDQSNQAADVTDSAATVVDASQDAASVNDATIVQSGSENGSQTAAATGTADTISNVSITGTSGNTTSIVQE